MVPVQHFEQRRKLVAGIKWKHQDADYRSELFNAQISFRWKPLIVQNVLDEIEQWISQPTAAPTLLLIGNTQITYRLT